MKEASETTALIALVAAMAAAQVWGWLGWAVVLALFVLGVVVVHILKLSWVEYGEKRTGRKHANGGENEAGEASNSPPAH